MTDKKNIIIISMDEVRPDHLSCYGYQKLKTPAIDRVAEEGVMFCECISCSELTSVAMGSVMTAKYPNHNGLRDPYCKLYGPSLGEILKKNGYATAGFVGNGLLSRQNRFALGFDCWSDTTSWTSWGHTDYNDGSGKIIYEGNDWRDSFFSWLELNHEKTFFMWGHYYETHGYSEDYLIRSGQIKKGELSEFGYYDAKINLVDQTVIDPLLKKLEQFDIAGKTILVLMSDHGTNLGEHPVTPLPWRDKQVLFPQHTTLYDCDLKVVMILRGPGITPGLKVQGMVRSIDLVPTLLELIEFQTTSYDFDGETLLPTIEGGVASGRMVYSEDLFEIRGEGALQAVRGDDYKFIRNLTTSKEEYYNLKNDPEEKNNIVAEIDEEELIKLRKQLNYFLITPTIIGESMDHKQREHISKSLRFLGYLK